MHKNVEIENKRINIEKKLVNASILFKNAVKLYSQFNIMHTIYAINKVTE